LNQKMLKATKNITLFFLLLLCRSSFSQQPETGNIKKVICKKDTSCQYALYLPKNYNDSTLFPLLIFLDPVARGDVPLLKYQTLADEMEIIMAGSYNSRNFDFTSSQTAFSAIYNDVVNKYSIRADAVWLSGFSGGARAASAIGMAYKEISGIIACGAGFADDETVKSSALKSYAAIVGSKDMNYTELLDNSRFLDSNNVNNIMLVFEGGHEWPGADHMGLAIEWLLQLSIPDFVARRGDKYLQKAVAELQAGYYYQSWQELHQLAKIKTYQKEAAEWAKGISYMKEFTADKKLFEDAEAKETNSLNRFSILLNKQLNDADGVSKKDWEQYSTELTLLTFNHNRYLQPASIRCSDHIYRSLSESYFHLMETGDYNKALRDAEVLTYFNPPVINPWYMMARASAMMDKKKKAAKFMKTAVQKGNLNKESVLNDKTMLKVFSKNEIFELFNKE
jgi:predicted esterase